MSNVGTEPKELDYNELTLEHFTVGQDAEGRPYAIRHTLNDLNNDVWRFSHVCVLARSGLTLRIAPLLQIGHGHEVLSTDPLHIEASILCEDCGTHGWVREGKWVAA